MHTYLYYISVIVIIRIFCISMNEICFYIFLKELLSNNYDHDISVKVPTASFCLLIVISLVYGFYIIS